MRRTVFSLISLFIVFFIASCIPAGPDLNATATQDTLNAHATQTAAAVVTATIPAATATLTPESATPTTQTVPEQASPTATQPSQALLQFIAYIQNGQLLVTDVTNGVKGGTTQYTMEGESDKVSDLVWSPSGEFVAFVSTAKGDPHIFYIYALGESSPTDLGPGSSPAWSPDSRSIAYIGGTYPDDNIWATNIDNPTPRQLTFETNHAWGRPVFTPDGQSLVVAGADRNNMGAQGNTTFTLESLALAGSGARTPLPGATPLEGVRLPYDLHFSPDGTKLAFSTSFHLSACASPGAYYISNADGSNRQEFVSPSLETDIDPNQEHYYVGLSYDWTKTSDGIIALGNVVDCGINSPNMGRVIAGPQISIIGLDGSERTIIPGFFYGISIDRTGTWIAAAHYEGGFQDLNPNVEIYSADTGQLVLSLGLGSTPEFQP